MSSAYQVTPAVSTMGFNVGTSSNYNNNLDLMVTLIQDNIDRRIDDQAFSYRKQWLKLAKDLLGSTFYSFAKSQRNNDHFYGNRYKFLIDTIKFIQTGKRDISIENWYELMEIDPKPRSNENESIRFQFDKVLESLTRDSTYLIIARWCSHPRGFNDLVHSMEIFFGPGRTTDLPVESLRSALPVRIVGY